MNEEQKNKEEDCPYCYKTFSTAFTRREHISYSHRGIIEFTSTKIYYRLLERIRTLEEEVSKLKKQSLKTNE